MTRDQGPVFKIELLPAREGDCILLEYGAPHRLGRILVDGGRRTTSQHILQRLQGIESVDLLVVSHIDRDHIEGVVSLLESGDGPAFEEVWFNAFRHVAGTKGERGARQGETLSGLLQRRRIPWNATFDGDAVAIGRDGGLPKIRMANGLVLTVLSPDIPKLRKLEPRWTTECERAGIVPGAAVERAGRGPRQALADDINIDELASRPFFPDDSLPNGTSIALLAEYSGRRILLAADAHEDRLLASVRSLRDAGPPLHLDLFKVPHHGSAGNLSKRLLEEIDCSRYAISSDGSHHGLPDPESIARIAKRSGPPCELLFNYRSAYTTPWEKLGAQSPAAFSTVYGDNGWLKIELL